MRTLLALVMVFALALPALAQDVEPVPVEPAGGTLTTVLLFVGALLVAVLWLMDRANKRLADSVPPDAMVLLRTAAAALQTLAERTPSKLDDDVVRLLLSLLGPEDETPDVE